MNGKREKMKSVLALLIETPNLKNQREMRLKYFKKYFSSLGSVLKILFRLIRKPIKFATKYTWSHMCENF